ncbi:hypothetical protein C0J52_20515 [Blattella germanica]|nr:hypothetical protein C0J52_20515 [Blattella germanica]
MTTFFRGNLGEIVLAVVLAVAAAAPTPGYLHAAPVAYAAHAYHAPIAYASPVVAAPVVKTFAAPVVAAPVLKTYHGLGYHGLGYHGLYGGHYF